MHLFVFILWMDSPTGRLLNLTWHLKNLFIYLPLIEISYFHYQYVTQRNYITEKQKQESILLLQCLILLIVNQAFYHLGVSMGDRISMDLHPFSGKVGIQGYDLYPVISGFMMCFHKYGYLALFCLYLIYFTTSKKPFALTSLSPCTNSVETNEILRTLKNMKRKSSASIPYWLSPTRSRCQFVLGIFVIYQVSSVAAYFLLLINYSPNHNIEASAIYSALWGTITCCFILFFIMESFFQYIATLRGISSSNLQVFSLFTSQKDHSL